MTEVAPEVLPLNESEQSTLDYFRAIEQEGVEACLANAAGTSFRCFEGEDWRVPILVSEGKANNAWLVSPRAQYLEYPVYEMSRDKGFLHKLALQCAALPLRAIFRATKFDRVVFVNHWLLLGGAVPDLPVSDWQTVFRRLQLEYPGHAIVFPGIVPRLSANHRNAILALGSCEALDIRGRTVHLLDPQRPLDGGKNRKKRYRRYSARRHFEAHRSCMIRDREELKQKVSRIHDLYKQLYLERYPKHLNPQYTQRFFEILLDCDLFDLRAWQFEDKEIEAFNVQLVDDDHFGWSAAGYDLQASKAKGLFRLVAAADLVASLDTGKVVNWGAGNADFKRLSGAVAAEELEFVLLDHLGFWRRLPWLLIRLLRGGKSEAPN